MRPSVERSWIIQNVGIERTWQSVDDRPRCSPASLGRLSRWHLLVSDTLHPGAGSEEKYQAICIAIRPHNIERAISTEICSCSEFTERLTWRNSLLEQFIFFFFLISQEHYRGTLTQYNIHLHTCARVRLCKWPNIGHVEVTAPTLRLYHVKVKR